MAYKEDMIAAEANPLKASKVLDDFHKIHKAISVANQALSNFSESYDGRQTESNRTDLAIAGSTQKPPSNLLESIRYEQENIVARIVKLTRDIRELENRMTSGTIYEKAVDRKTDTVDAVSLSALSEALK